MTGAAEQWAAPVSAQAQPIATSSEPDLPSQDPIVTPTTTDIKTEPAPLRQWSTATVRSGDNLSTIFSRFGLSGQEVYRFVSGHSNAKALTRLQPGETMQLLVEDKQLKALKYAPNALDTQTFERLEKGFSYDLHTKVPEVRQTYREATIDSSLFLAAAKAGMDDSLIMELANIFGWDIDFVLDIRQGDKFRVVFEEEFLDGEKFANGNILAAEFVNKGKPYQAVRYTDSNGYSQYFTPDGQSMRKEFLRTPVDFARISSHFNLRRKHPVLNTIRAHKGTDYAAPTGTPIKAVGDGKVVFAGRKGGYGNVVQIQHGQTYKTLYAHMSKFRRGIKKGATVKQGQVIGYVGSTGLATGPHLHYEFYVNGAVRNPVTVKLPKARSIASSEMVRFSQQTQPLLASLGLGTTQLAMKEPDSSGE
jgi:murein DD-endopeptidase MepM/ murein hydrolase activator NlpD